MADLIVQNLKMQIENLLNFGMFSEVKDTGQNMITSRWILNEKESHDGQKVNMKA